MLGFSDYESVHHLARAVVGKEVHNTRCLYGGKPRSDNALRVGHSDAAPTYTIIYSENTSHIVCVCKSKKIIQ